MAHISGETNEFNLGGGSQVLYQSGLGFYPLPTQFMGGPRCSSSNYVKFGEPTTTSCVAEITSLRDACKPGSDLTIKRLQESLKIGRFRASQLEKPEHWVDVIVTAYRFRKQPLVIIPHRQATTRPLQYTQVHVCTQQ